MKALLGGIVFTAAIGLVGCGGSKNSDSGNTEKKETEVDKTKDQANAKFAKSLQDLEDNVAYILDALKKAQPLSPDELVKMVENKVLEVLAPLKDSSNIDADSFAKMKESLSELKTLMAGLNQDKASSNEQINALILRLSEFEKNMDMRQTPFHKACIASLNVADADDLMKRNVLNAIAFVNTSKFARATETTQSDFDNAGNLKYGHHLPGVVFSGTRSEFRQVDDSYTYYAYSRLPSVSNFDSIRYHAFTTDAHTINGFDARNIEHFLVNDQNNNYTSADLFTVLNEQNPLRAIDANKIESYNRTDCDRVATYMANVGSKTLTTAIDNPNYIASINAQSSASYVNGIKNRTGGDLVSDIFSWLDFRMQESEKSSNALKGYTDSPRVMVIQDDLLRRNVDGSIDYSFLDLVDAPHLRFLAALDSEIGKAKVEDGVDFDNAYKGKNESLINFVTRHRKDVDHPRHDKGYKDLEAVFISFVPELVQAVEPEVKKKGKNLFHTP